MPVSELEKNAEKQTKAARTENKRLIGISLKARVSCIKVEIGVLN
jgi:hypothetical protein